MSVQAQVCQYIFQYVGTNHSISIQTTVCQYSIPVQVTNTSTGHSLSVQASNVACYDIVTIYQYKSQYSSHLHLDWSLNRGGSLGHRKWLLNQWCGCEYTSTGHSRSLQATMYQCRLHCIGTGYSIPVQASVYWFRPQYIHTGYSTIYQCRSQYTSWNVCSILMQITVHYEEVVKGVILKTVNFGTKFWQIAWQLQF